MGGRKRIGFAGVIDNRIYFAMVQCICEVFSDCDVIFAGEVFGTYPVWMHGFDNLHYIPVSYEELPSMIQSLDIGILPFLEDMRIRFQRNIFNTLPAESR